MPTTEQLDEAVDGDLPVVNVHSVSADRTVFTEEGNEDGWISTDVTVSLRR